MTKANTHLGIDAALCGSVVSVEEASATTRFTAIQRMAADERGLVHGGFVFGLADYAAMLAVNDPNVVLGAAQSRFLAPVAVGDVVTATASVIESKGRKHIVEAVARVGDRDVFTATFTTFVLDQHVLDGQS